MADSGRFVYGGAPATGGFRIPDVGEHAMDPAKYSTTAVADGAYVQIVFSNYDNTGDPLEAGVIDVGQGVTLKADHKTLHFPASGWWYVAWAATLTAVSDAAGTVLPIACGLAPAEHPVFIPAGKSVRAAGGGAVFAYAAEEGPAITVHSVSGDLTVNSGAYVYIWRLDAPYEGV